ncbi:hypothetical protein CVIRNUC_002679 [Coccomyxa viridis]|uniref:ABC transporter domain-containing protein n=1 Tax=Coccomyxa viridis TaxID=1274662 RepID=A0AAV1HZH7_9CHLO|nr:hypothetical protein CVIRNUC_002679 [Coccomyxa viridis]
MQTGDPQPWHIAWEDTAWTPDELFKARESRRRMSLGTAPPAEDGHERDPEELVEEDQELVRAAMERQEGRISSTFRHVVPVSEAGQTDTVLDLKKLRKHHQQLLVDRALQTKDQDNELVVQKLKERYARVSLEIPTVTVQYEDCSIDATVHVGSRALPSVWNSYRDKIEAVLMGLRLMRSRKRPFSILKDVTGAVKPGRMTLLLGPPGAGKTTLLKALAGKLQNTPDLKLSGSITYNGEGFDKFYPQRTAAYVDQVDLHLAELTVKETLNFSARVLGPGTKKDDLRELRARERKLGIQPDPDLDGYQKAAALHGQRSSPITLFIMRLLGLEVCAGTKIGNNMIRGVSGGQRKRVTTGEMMVGPAKLLFLDEISTGLDSSTTFLIVKCIRNAVKAMRGTVLMALLQPAPEVYHLFDDILLLCEGHVVFHGPREDVLPFFSNLGFQLPERKGIADFLQEIISKKDQQQYWANDTQPYRFVPVAEFAAAFKESSVGRSQAAAGSQKSLSTAGRPGSDPLVRQRYALGPWDMFKACAHREWILMRRHSFTYLFRIIQNTFIAFVVATLWPKPHLNQDSEAMGTIYAAILFFSLMNLLFDAFSEMSMIVEMLPIFYTQRDNLFYTAWAFGLPATLLRVPFSLAQSLLWSLIIYWSCGLAPTAARFFTFWLLTFLTHLVAVNMFRLIGTIGRNIVVAFNIAWGVFILVVLLSGYTLIKPNIHPWYIGGYWALPLQWLVMAIMNNEFLDERWQKPDPHSPGQTLGESVMQQFDFRYGVGQLWLGVGVAVAWNVVMVSASFLCLIFLNPVGKQAATMPEELLHEREYSRTGVAPAGSNPALVEMTAHDSAASAGSDAELGKAGPKHAQQQQHQSGTMSESRKRQLSRRAASEGMSLPFCPLNLAFRHMYYSVDMPSGHQGEGEHVAGASRPQLTLLSDISGAFRPGRLTCLMGVSGAGKTTLMDVLAGRKTGGLIRGTVTVDGHPKVAETFCRVASYVEQFDIHSPGATVYEALIFSAELRLMDVSRSQMRTFVAEVMGLMELTSLKGSLVGLPGQSGLSVEQRKRLTIGVELVANPSIIFMDEPTSGLDARAAAIVMRTVRNTVNTGRTVVCTIHQPSIDIFEAFDELLLLKRGGRAIYCGPTGHESQRLIDYFEAHPGVQPIPEGTNPASWMLEVTSLASEGRLGVDFADTYTSSQLARENDALVEKLQVSAPGSQPLRFHTRYSTGLLFQFKTCLTKNVMMYWRNTEYNAVRLFSSCFLALLFGSIFWNLGSKRDNALEIQNVIGALTFAAMFLGTSNASTVQPVIDTERTVFYRERAAGYYSEIPFAVAQVLVEVPYLLAQAVLFSSISYWMVHFEADPGKFFWYVFFIFIILFFFTAYGMTMVAVVPNIQVASTLSTTFYALFFLFSGFLQPASGIPPWWIWWYYINPVAWAIQGLVGSQLGTVTDEYITVTGERYSIADYMAVTYGIRYSMVGWSALILVGFTCLLSLITMTSLRFLNFQKR